MGVGHDGCERFVECVIDTVIVVELRPVSCLYVLVPSIEPNVPRRAFSQLNYGSTNPPSPVLRLEPRPRHTRTHHPELVQQ